MKIKRSLSYLATLALICSSLVGTSSATANSASKSLRNDAASFWTAKRINEAIAFDMVFEKGSKVAKRVPVAREARRPGGGGGGSGSTSIIGASWNNNGLPLTASGKVFFTFGSGYYQCSGSLVKDSDPDFAIVLTAAHCMFEHNKDSSGNSIPGGELASNWIFVPSYDVAQVTLTGCLGDDPKCYSTSLLSVRDEYKEEAGFTMRATQFDWGFAKITQERSGLLPDETTIDEVYGGSNAFPISDAAMVAPKEANSFGYPAAGKYKGNDLVYSRGPISFDANNFNLTYALASDMTGGCSGGPWLSDLNPTLEYTGFLRSVNSYKYGTTKFIYGPIFSNKTLETLEEAKGL